VAEPSEVEIAVLVAAWAAEVRESAPKKTTAGELC
jgi:hypothetical protein